MVKSKFEDYSNYRCCCSCFHVKTGIQIIAVLQTVLAIFGLLIFVSSQKVDTVLGALEILSIVGEFAGLLILCTGIKKESANWLLPYIIFECLTVLVSIAFIACAIFAYGDPTGNIADSYNQYISAVVGGDNKIFDKTEVQTLIAFSIFLAFTAIIIFVWYINIIYKYYVYLKVLNEGRVEGQNGTKILYKLKTFNSV